MDPAAIDNDVFIEAVKHRQCVWDPASPEYHDRARKRTAWEDICRDVYPEFVEETDYNKEKIVALLMKKWKNFRDSYLRSVKKKAQSAKIRAYVYTKQLEFLSTVKASPSPAAPNVHEESQPISEDGFYEILSGPSSMPPSSEAGSPPPPDPGPIAPPIAIVQESVHSRKRRASFTDLPPKKRRAIVEESLLNFIKCSSNDSQPDDDRSFFDSLLPMVKTLPPDAKLEFRLRTLELLREVRGAAGPREPLETHFAPAEILHQSIKLEEPSSPDTPGSSPDRDMQ